MRKLERKSSGSNPISRKVLSGLRKPVNRKVIDISELRNAKIHAENLEKSVITENELSKLDPLHGIYAYAQNKISVFIEEISALPALSKLTNAHTDAEDVYMPSGPPMSPLTTSYFSCWGFFDLCVGIKKESFGTVIIDICRSLGVDKGLITVFECMQNSRMGFYIHEGVSQGFVHLRELITKKQMKVIVPSGYTGGQGELWFARVMPEPFAELNYGYSIVFTTPYIILEMQNRGFVTTSEMSWDRFFARNLGKTKIEDTNRAYESLMKFGLNRHYWNEYIFEGYVSHQDDMILLAGFPDIPLSRPHSKENSEGF
jgi:hypothetical protein